MASGMIAGAALAGALSWLPWAHHHPQPQPDQAQAPADAAAQPQRPVASHYVIIGLHSAKHADKHPPKASVPGEVGGARYLNQSGALLVPVRVKDRGPYYLILDTGSANSSLDSRTAYQAGIAFWGENASPPATDRESSPRRLAATTFEVGDAPLFSAAPHALYKPYHLAGSARGRLGRDVLGGFVVRIDPRYRLISIHDPLRITKPINAVTLPLTVKDDGYYVPVTLRLADGSAVTRDARLDTGLPWTMADDAATISRIKAVELGGWSVPQTAGQGPGVGAPTIGLGLLRSFIVTIDVPDRLVFLQSAGAYRTHFQFMAHHKGDEQPAKPKKKKRFGIFG
jgi:hypothetical protein